MVYGLDWHETVKAAVERWHKDHGEYPGSNYPVYSKRDRYNGPKWYHASNTTCPDPEDRGWTFEGTVAEAWKNEQGDDYDLADEGYYDEISNIIAFEEGELSEEETIKLFQHLVDTGLAWKLQGMYGRTAVSMIDAGLIQGEYTVPR